MPEPKLFSPKAMLSTSLPKVKVDLIYWVSELPSTVLSNNYLSSTQICKGLAHQFQTIGCMMTMTAQGWTVIATGGSVTA